MLRLLPNVLYSKLSERRFFLHNLFLFVLLLHVFIFLIPFLASRITQKHDKFTISMHQAGATYVLMPFQKTVDQNSMNISKSNSDISQKSQVMGYDEYLHHKKHTKKIAKKNSKVSQLTSKKQQEIEEKIKKTKSKSTAVLADTSYTKKRLSKKKLLGSKNKKKLKSKKKKKNKIKIIEQKQNDTVEIAKEADVTQESQQIQEEVSNIELATNESLVGSEETLSPISDNVIFVGYEQFDQCVIGSKIQHAIIQSWTPPVGLDQGISCEMKITVSADGVAHLIEVIKGSGILMFDMSARSALQEIEFPKEVHGKTIMLVLGN